MFLPDHPLRFDPIFRSYIWGGERLASQLGKKPPASGVWAESWEIVDHREGESSVSEGPFQGWTIRQLIESFPVEITGYDTPRERFPLLLKYLDCQRDLSVQVHPDDEYGSKMETPDRGKTEAWYVIDAEPGAVLYAGLKQGIDRPTLVNAIAEGKTEECLHVLHPKAGDCVFIPAGTVHALGAGLLVAEIQQASDCTFRLFDWNRVDKDGKPRALHVEQAIEVIDFDRGPISFVSSKEESGSQSSTNPSNPWRSLVECDKFILCESKSISPLTLPSNRVSILTIPKGSATLRCGDKTLELQHAETVLVPAACKEVILQLQPDSIALLSTLPNS